MQTVQQRHITGTFPRKGKKHFRVRVWESFSWVPVEGTFIVTDHLQVTDLRDTAGNKLVNNGLRDGQRLAVGQIIDVDSQALAVAYDGASIIRALVPAGSRLLVVSPGKAGPHGYGATCGILA